MCVDDVCSRKECNSTCLASTRFSFTWLLR